MLQVWVDGRYGDDTQAIANNPTVGDCQGQPHPHDVLVNGSPLLRAAAPFKTVTAAVAYIRGITPNGMPMVHGNGVTTTHAIIHVMPGLYGVGTGIDQHTGLRLNGETFPIHLPDRVSLQGTSALNTVFIGTGDAPVFEFGCVQNALPSGAPASAGPEPEQFVAQIAITGQMRSEDTHGQNSTFEGVPQAGAAIFVNQERRASLLVANA
ncbi:MAG: hypothetical protein Fur0037_22450 [Planctomycetota bacterium]